MTDKHYVPTNEEAERLIELYKQIDDLTRERGKSRRAVRDAITLLEVLPHAAEHGRVEVVTEYVERVLETLQPYAAKE